MNKSSQIRGISQRMQKFAVVSQTGEFCKSSDVRKKNYSSTDVFISSSLNVASALISDWLKCIAVSSWTYSNMIRLKAFESLSAAVLSVSFQTWLRVYFTPNELSLMHVNDGVVPWWSHVRKSRGDGGTSPPEFGVRKG